MNLSNTNHGNPLSSRQAIWIYFYSIVSFITLKLIQDYPKGGNSWKQGDWLINSTEVEVRRGWLGSLILNISDFLHVSPLLIAILLQGFLFAILSIAIFRIIKKEGLESPITWLILSPFFVLIFWGNDPQGSMRKELFSYAAIALVVLSQISAPKHASLLKASGVLIFVLGGFAHEINLMLAPAFLFALYCATERQYFPKFLIWTIPVIVGGVVSAKYNISHSIVQNIESVCTPLLQRGLVDGICDGAIKWLTYTPADGYQSVLARWAKGGGMLFLLFYAAAFILAIRVSAKFNRTKWVVALFIALSIPTLPLYFVAIDYGRWMSIHFTIFVLCIVSMKYGGLLTQHVQITKRELVAMLLIAPVLSPHHELGKSDSRVVLAIVTGILIYIIFMKLKKILQSSMQVR